MVEAGAQAYSRASDLPRLIPLWPHELGNASPEGGLRILSKLRRALRAERRRGPVGIGATTLTAIFGLLSAYQGEIAALPAKLS